MTKKRLISLALALVLALSLAPTALAAEGKISRLPKDERPAAPESKDFSQYLTGEPLSKEELTVKGVPFYEYTYSEAKAVLPFKEPSASGGRVPEEGEHEQYMTWKHNPTGCSSVSHYVGSDDLVAFAYSCCDTWSTEAFTVIDTEIRGIKTGDSLESVLQALGFSAEGAPIIAAEMMDNHTNLEIWEPTGHVYTQNSSYDHQYDVGLQRYLDAPSITWRWEGGIYLSLDFFVGRLGDVYMSDASKIPMPAPSFTDVPEDEWYAAPVAWAQKKKIANGTSETTFSPGRDCTQVEILTFLYRAAGEPETSADLPVDIKGKNIAYAEAALRWAAEKGMIDETFDVGALCTRATAVSYIWQAFGKLEAEKSSLTDVPDGADYAAAVNWAVASGVTNGVTETTFGPEDVCSRGHIVTFLYRAYVQGAS